MEEEDSPKKDQSMPDIEDDHILNQTHQTLTTVKSTPQIGLEKKLIQKKAIRVIHGKKRLKLKTRPLNEVPYSDHEARQALFFKPYQDIGS
ncbi:hypothetical protein HID58_055579, partial [Brassica napus]